MAWGRAVGLVFGGSDREATLVSIAGPGAVRGATAAAALVLAVVTLPVALSGEASFAWTALPFVALAGFFGAVCGTIAGRLLDNGYTWHRAAVISAAAASITVVGVLLVLTGGQITESTGGLLTVAALLGGGSIVVAVWQSWAMARRQDRARLPRPQAQV